MDLGETVERRRMTRSFSGEALEETLLDRIIALALRAPSAGFTQSVEWLVLTSKEHRRAFFEATCDEEFLKDPKGLSGLLRAPAIVVPVVDPEAYRRRYAEPDKEASSLAGVPARGWPVPYWIVDAAFSTMIVLLAAENEGLGALFFRLHRDLAQLEAAFAVPSGRVVIGAIALGRPGEVAETGAGKGGAGRAGRAGRAASKGGPGGAASPARTRLRRPISEMVHKGSW